MINFIKEMWDTVLWLLVLAADPFKDDFDDFGY
jgi:hypothetical protein